MSRPQDGGEEFQVIRLSAEERETALDGTLVEYLGDTSCYAEYSHGIELETAAGDIVERETAGLSMIYTSVVREGIGSRLMARVIEEARGDEFRYLRLSPIINRYMVSVVERMMREDIITTRAYRLHRPGDMFDLPSGELLKTSDVLPKEAAGAVRKVPRVECVIEL